MLKQVLSAMFAGKPMASGPNAMAGGGGEPVTVITSFHPAGFAQYGQEFVKSFDRHWPSNYKLVVYAEEFTYEPESPRITVLDLHAEIPALREFKRRHGAVPAARGQTTKGYDYRFDAVRFANKSYVMCEAARRADTRLLLWLDGDTRSFLNVPTDFLVQLLRPGEFMAYLGRTGYHTETGFLPFDLQHPAAKEFFAALQSLYETDTIFTLREWHDCEAIDTCRAVFTAQGKMAARNLNRYGSGHPFINSVAGLFMDHMKGPNRKQAGSSAAQDYLVPPASRVGFGGRYAQLPPLLHHLAPRDIVEVGTWSGWRAVQMALISLEQGLDVTYRGYDVFDDFTPEFDAREMNVKPHFSRDEVGRLLNLVADLYPRFSFELLQGNTNDTLKDERADFVFLDGGHSYETILNDFEAVKKSRVILLDDYYAGGIDTEGFGCNRVIAGIQHQVLPVKDAVRGGGTTQFALVSAEPLPEALLQALVPR